MSSSPSAAAAVKFRSTGTFAKGVSVHNNTFASPSTLHTPNPLYSRVSHGGSGSVGFGMTSAAPSSSKKKKKISLEAAAASSVTCQRPRPAEMRALPPLLPPPLQLRLIFIGWWWSARLVRVSDDHCNSKARYPPGTSLKAGSKRFRK
jgi:hypothetical protein